MAKRPKKAAAEGANWMDTYGDMVTLILTFFVLLYSMSTIDQQKMQYIAEAFSSGKAADTLNEVAGPTDPMSSPTLVYDDTLPDLQQTDGGLTTYVESFSMYLQSLEEGGDSQEGPSEGQQSSAGGQSTEGVTSGNQSNAGGQSIEGNTEGDNISGGGQAEVGNSEGENEASGGAVNAGSSSGAGDGSGGAAATGTAGLGGEAEGISSGGQSTFEGFYQYIEAQKRAQNLSDTMFVSMNNSALSIRFTDNMMFEPNSDELTPDGVYILSMISDGVRMISNQIGSVDVSGHTADSGGSSDVNEWRLSSGRADSVLILFDELDTVDPNLMSATGYGKYRPIADNSTPEGRALNRRVEIIFTKANLDYSDPAVSEDILALMYGDSFTSYSSPEGAPTVQEREAAAEKARERAEQIAAQTAPPDPNKNYADKGEYLSAITAPPTTAPPAPSFDPTGLAE
ncbi:MAG: OmpA family protein [Ruminococcus sp.]|nr:OmpA family protein [Ruminococcus sp.]